MKTFTPSQAIKYVAGASAREHEKHTRQALDEITQELSNELSQEEVIQIASSVGVSKTQLTNYISSQELDQEQATRLWDKYDITALDETRRSVERSYAPMLHAQLSRVYPQSIFTMREGGAVYETHTLIREQHPKQVFGFFSGYTNIASISLRRNKKLVPHIDVYDERFLIACEHTLDELSTTYERVLEEPKISSSTLLPELKESGSS